MAQFISSLYKIQLGNVMLFLKIIMFRRHTSCIKPIIYHIIFRNMHDQRLAISDLFINHFLIFYLWTRSLWMSWYLSSTHFSANIGNVENTTSRFQFWLSKFIVKIFQSSYSCFAEFALIHLSFSESVLDTSFLFMSIHLMIKKQNKN